jgi:hypothetical protein
VLCNCPLVVSNNKAHWAPSSNDVGLCSNPLGSVAKEENDENNSFLSEVNILRLLSLFIYFLSHIGKFDHKSMNRH